MDKLKREAERSGDSLRYALELRRQGRNIPAKRLIQELAWDEHERALEALDQLYPLDPELQSSLDSLAEDVIKCIFYVSDFLGSLDPRVNKEIVRHLEVGLQFYGEEAAIGEDLQGNLELAQSRSLLERLKVESGWSSRFTWADPLEEELSLFLDWFETDLLYRNCDNYNREDDFLLGWTIQKFGTKALLKRWLKGFKVETWRERCLEGWLRGSVSATKVPDSEVEPSWANASPFGSIAASNHGLSAWSYLSRELGQGWKPKTALVQSDCQSLIYLKLGSSKKGQDPTSSEERTQLHRKLVSVWQEQVGDRVLVHDLDSIVPWEFDKVSEVSEGLLAVSKSILEQTELSGFDCVFAGIAEIEGDWESAIESARRLCLEAEDREQS